MSNTTVTNGKRRELIRGDAVPFPFLIWLVSLAGLLVVNYVTQPYEDSISLVPPTTPFYLDFVWYLDDIIGPSLFMTAGIVMLRRFKMNLAQWPLLGLAFSCLAFSLGDTTDAHWVFSKGLVEARDESISFSSWMSKVMVVIIFYFFIIHAYDFFDRKAQKAMIFGAVLIYIDQIQMSISLDFAGYSFHVFEETLEVVTSLFFCLGVACGRLKAAVSGS